VFLNITSKKFSGLIDICFGFDREIIRPKSIEYFNGKWINIAKQFTKIYKNFNGMNVWYFATFNIEKNKEYHCKYFLDLLPVMGTFEAKYFIAIKRNSDTIQEAIQKNAFYVLDPWLGESWDQRMLFTLESDDVSEVLTNFPTLVYLSSSSGISNDDITAIFDEVGANSQKIAFTTSDGETQCYAEIESWDSTGEEAWIWVQVPSVSNTSDTDMYLYYDNDASDNTAYIGLNGDTTAQNVWPLSEYMAVYHSVDNTTSSILDSTANNYDGTKVGANEPNEISGQINSAQDYDNVNDRIDLDGRFDLSNNDFTIEAILECNGSQNDPVITNWAASECSWDTRIGWDGGPDDRWYLFVTNNEQPSGQTVNYYSKKGLVDNVAYYCIFTKRGGRLYSYVYDTSAYGEEDEGAFSVTVSHGDNTFVLGKFYGYNAWFDGFIDEVRVQNVSRTYAWINATWQTQLDDFIEWGTVSTRSTTVTQCTTISNYITTTAYSTDSAYYTSGTTTCSTFETSAQTTTTLCSSITGSIISVDVIISISEAGTNSIDISEYLKGASFGTIAGGLGILFIIGVPLIFIIFFVKRRKKE